jgi:hypothetical protein
MPIKWRQKSDHSRGGLGTIVGQRPLDSPDWGSSVNDSAADFRRSRIGHTESLFVIDIITCRSNNQSVCCNIIGMFPLKAKMPLKKEYGPEYLELTVSARQQQNHGHFESITWEMHVVQF